MRDKVRTASHYLYQLEKDNAELLRRFAELATLRELVRQSEEGQHTKQASPEAAVPILPTKPDGPYYHHYRTGG